MASNSQEYGRRGRPRVQLRGHALGMHIDILHARILQLFERVAVYAVRLPPMGWTFRQRRNVCMTGRQFEDGGTLAIAARRITGRPRH